MRPPDGNKSPVQVWAYPARPTGGHLTSEVAQDAERDCEARHHRQKHHNGLCNVAERQLRASAGTTRDRQKQSQPGAHPPRSNDTPSERQQRGRLGREHRRVEDCEVLEADERRELVVDDGTLRPDRSGARIFEFLCGSATPLKLYCESTVATTLWTDLLHTAISD